MILDTGFIFIKILNLLSSYYFDKWEVNYNYMKTNALMFSCLLSLLFLISCSGKSEGAGGITEELDVRSSKIDNKVQELDSAIFAGGCFWCTEVYFEEIFGVKDVISGYSGGAKGNANYEQVSSGKTAHAESILIIYNPEIVSYQKLLEVFFYTMDPTQLNRQGNDVGPQYRSVVFYQNAQQKKEAEEYIAKLDASGEYKKSIVTTVEPFKNFFEAETYHQDFYKKNPNNPYINAVAKPKKQKFEKKFQELLQP